MPQLRPVVLALLLSTAAVAVPVAALAHCPPAKAKPHKVRTTVVKKAKARVVACNCATARPRPKPRPVQPAPPAPPPVDHAPYVDTGTGEVDYGPSRVVDLNVEGWETATYTRRIIDHRIVTYHYDGPAPTAMPVPDPRYCRDRRHRHY